MKTFWGKFKNKYVLVSAAVIALAVIIGAIAAPHIFAGEPVSQAEAIAPVTESPSAEAQADNATSEATPTSEASVTPTSEATATTGEQGESEPATADTPATDVPAEAPQPAEAPVAAAPAVEAPVAPAPAAVPAPAPAAPAPAAPAPAKTVEPELPAQTDYQSLVYGMVRNWCPRSNIVVDHQNVVSGDVYGWSWWGISTIAIRSNIPMTITKDIALHECGHILQEIAFRPNPNTNGSQTEAINRFNQIYGTTGRGGIEANADCISGYLAQYVQPYSGAASSLTQRWNSQCTGAKGDAAIKVIQGARP